VGKGMGEFWEMRMKEKIEKYFKKFREYHKIE